MFYGSQLISRKDPLHLIFLAGMMNKKKLSKKKIILSNIEELSKQIVAPKLQLTLRVSGTLLLGIVVIYQRKLQYLLAEGNDILANVRLIDMTSRNLNIDLPLAPRSQFDTITLPAVDPLLFLAMQKRYENNVIDFNDGDLSGFRQNWKHLLMKGANSASKTFGSEEENLTITVSINDPDVPPIIAHPDDITLDEVVDVPNYQNMILDEDIFQTSVLDITFDQDGPELGNDISFGGGGFDVHEEHVRDLEVSQENEPTTETPVRRRKRKYGKLQIDNESEISSEEFRANVLDPCITLLSEPRPHLAMDTSDGRETLQWMLGNPTSDVQEELAKIYVSILEDQRVERPSKRTRRADKKSERDKPEKQIRQEEENDFGGIGGFGDEQEPADLPRNQSFLLSPIKRNSLLDNSALVSIFTDDTNRSFQKNLDISTDSTRNRSCAMQNKSWMFLDYIKPKLSETEGCEFQDLISTRDPQLAALSFYHLLVLATNDVVRVKQPGAYRSIHVTRGSNFTAEAL